MTNKELKEIASYYCDLFERFSINPDVDRMEPKYRVGTSDLTAKYPELHLTDLVELNPYIKSEMKRRKLKWR